MTTGRVDHVASQIRSLLTLGSPSGLADGQLVGWFADGDEGASRLAFETLVERHGPMVLRVCRGVLRDSHDAQDAFQATFLVLARKARSIRDRDSVASWLHGVALRVAGHARAGEARRRRAERAAVGRVETPSVDETDDDLGPRLHEEVGRLPEHYRAAVVLCYLEGHTCEDAARLLNWPVGTVKSRLSRARERLRARLTRCGLPSALPWPLAPLPLRLVKATTELAARFGARSTAPASSLGAVALAEGVLKVMPLAKWKTPAIALLVASGLGVASALATPRAVQEPRPEAREEVQEGPRAQPPTPDPVALTIPHHLAAEAGRGTALVFQLDAKGERVPDEDEAKTAAAAAREEADARKEALRKADEALKAGDPKALERAFAEAKAVLDARARPRAGRWKEAEAGLRWVAVTGVVDNQGVREALAMARNVDLSAAFPDYLRVEVQRQIRWPDGDWATWREIDFNENYLILDNLPELSKERMPAEVRPPALVDPLPVLTKGTWSGVDPERILKLPKPGPDKVSANGKPLLGSPLLAIRSLDFTVDPGTTYRYRARIVLANPDVTKGGKKHLFGPWSGPTKEVAVP